MCILGLFSGKCSFCKIFYKTHSADFSTSGSWYVCDDMLLRDVSDVPIRCGAGGSQSGRIWSFFHPTKSLEKMNIDKKSTWNLVWTSWNKNFIM